jgi:hypothetical protein
MFMHTFEEIGFVLHRIWSICRGFSTHVEKRQETEGRIQETEGRRQERGDLHRMAYAIVAETNPREKWLKSETGCNYLKIH